MKRPVKGRVAADVIVASRYVELIEVEDKFSERRIDSITTPTHGDWPGALKIFPIAAAIRIV